MPREITLSNDIYLTSVKKFLSQNYIPDQVVCSPKLTGLLLKEYNLLTPVEKQKVHEDFKVTEIELIQEKAIILVNTDLYNIFIELLQLYGELDYEKAKEKFVFTVFAYDKDLQLLGVTPIVLKNKEKEKKVELIRIKKIANGVFPKEGEQVDFYNDYLQKIKDHGLSNYTKSKTHLCELSKVKNYTDAFYKQKLEACSFMKLKRFSYPDVDVEKYAAAYFHNFDVMNRRNVIAETPYTSLDEFAKVSDDRKSLKYLSFVKDGIASECVLKTAYPTKHTDSIVYEYRVGQFINSIMHRYTCFIRTYQLYKIADDKTIEDYIHCKPRLLPSMLSRVVKINNVVPINVGCKDSDNFVLCTKYVPNNLTLDRFLNDPKFEADRETNILQILYQVYYALNDLRDNFTHYDLHTGNVMLCELGRGAKFVYPAITFNSKYIAKIIDYGRCFYYINENINTRTDVNLLRESCSKEEMRLVYSYDTEKYWNGISANRNMSHDLRLINTCMHNLERVLGKDEKKKRAPFYKTVKGIIELIDYVNNPEKDKEKEVDPPVQPNKKEMKKVSPNEKKVKTGVWRGFGAPESEHCVGETICNVEIVERRLRELIADETFISTYDPSVTIDCTRTEVAVTYRVVKPKGGTKKVKKNDKFRRTNKQLKNRPFKKDNTV